MKIQAVLNEGFILLSGLKIETAMLDATVLLAEALQVSKEKLFCYLHNEMSPKQYNIYKTYLGLRRAGHPVSYIRKKKEFFDIEFYVDKRVLVPRPDTELLVEISIQIINNNPWTSQVHDLCTGSGCIAIVLKKQFPNLQISASDISTEAGEVFRLNCMKILGYPIPFTRSNLFSDIPDKFDIITANPPYLRDAEYEKMKKTGWPEPEMALRGGINGLEVSRQLVKSSVYHLNHNGFLILESGFDCMDELFYIFSQEGFQEISITKDLGGRDRVITGRWP